MEYTFRNFSDRVDDERETFVAFLQELVTDTATGRLKFDPKIIAGSNYYDDRIIISAMVFNYNRYISGKTIKLLVEVPIRNKPNALVRFQSHDVFWFLGVSTQLKELLSQ